jgi:hypothetical protein
METRELKTGISIPECIISEPKLQRVIGFSYLYLEETNIFEDDALRSVRRITPKIYEEYMRVYSTENVPALLVRFLDQPERKMYTVQVGYKIGKEGKEGTNAEIERIKSTVVAGILVWGTNWSVPKSYSPLSRFIKENEYEETKEWREWHIYYEDDYSKNNITWVQRTIKKKEKHLTTVST